MNRTIINLIEIGIHFYQDEKGKQTIENLITELKVKFEWGSLHKNEPRLIIFSNNEREIHELIARIGILEGIARCVDQLNSLQE